MISSLKWARKGAAKSTPVMNNMTDENFEEMYKNDDEFIEDTDMDEESVQESKMNDEEKQQLDNAISAQLDEELDDIDKKYNLDSYDDDDEDELIPGLSAKNSLYYKNGEQDPYLIGDEVEDDLEDLEDLQIRNTDGLLLAAMTDEDQFSHLNIYLFEEDQENLYIHHDIVLKAFPLCIEWLNFNPQSEENNNNNEEEGEEKVVKGNLAAVGTFLPDIEIWDLDVINTLEPLFNLGGIDEELSRKKTMELHSKASKNKKKRKKQKKKKKKIKPVTVLKEDSHSDAVMSLSWNTSLKNILASGSADKTIKLWDLNTQSCLQTLKHSKGKIQALEWHKTENSCIISGGYDRVVSFLDVRSPNDILSWNINSEVEAIEWNNFNTSNFLVSSDDGYVRSYDIRKASDNDTEPLFSLSAHSKATSALALNPLIENFLVTASVEKSIKFWDIANNQPTLIQSIESVNEQLFALSWYYDNPFYLAAGGKDYLKVVNTFDYKSIQERFGR